MTSSTSLFPLTHVSALLITAPFTAFAQTPLLIPPTLSGASIDLSIQEGSWEFHPGETVQTYGYNGNLLGPTLILDQGQQVTLNVTNTLPDLTTTHWHGLHVSAENDGGPHSMIMPNTTWSPSFTVLDRASTYWYHPHAHGLTDYQVSMGLAGMIIVRDPQEAAVPLPRTYGVDDIPLILQAKAIVDGQIALHTGLDSIITVNGIWNAMASVPAQIVRLRCLNGASERTFHLGFDNGMTFYVIGSDGGLLSTMEGRTRLRLMPGERVEMLVDLGAMQGNTFRMMAYNSELPNGIVGSAQVGDGSATLDGYDENALNGADFPLLAFSVTTPTPDAVTVLPDYLVTLTPFEESDADVTRTFLIQPEGSAPLEQIEGPFEINGALFDMDVINEVVQLGATEIWQFMNTTMVGHPIHIHDIQFNILDRDGAAPEGWESGWKDVVFVPPLSIVRVITRFDDFADPDTPYMYHCHMLMHEDEGMMGQFLVVDPDGITEHTIARATVWPNPTTGNSCSVEWPGAHGAVQVALMDPAGRILQLLKLNNLAQAERIPLPQLATGMYTLNLRDAVGQEARATLSILH